jgi:hypothetical protein
MRSSFARAAVAFAAAALALVAAGAAAGGTGNSFAVTPLVSDNVMPGTITDASLVNAWGLVAGPATPWWVADNGTGVSTLYTGAGAKIARTVVVGDDPTGVVFNGSTGFAVKGGNAGPGLFLFDSEAGVISAWNGSLGNTAEHEIDMSAEGAVFKGLAIAQTAAGPRLYATDFQTAASTSSTARGSRFRARLHSSIRRSHGTSRRSGSRRSAPRSTSRTRRRSPAAATRPTGPGSYSWTPSTRRTACSPARSRSSAS